MVTAHSLTDNKYMGLSVTDEPELAPGLLRVLQQASCIRMGFFFAGLILFALIRPGGRSWGQLGLMVAESAVLVGFVVWPEPRRRLGRWFLPIALAWCILLPFVERAISLTAGVRPQVWLSGAPMVLDEGDISLIWLLVPVVLIAWQYGRRWFGLALGVVVVGYAWLGLLLGGDVFLLGGHALMSAGRLALITLLGFVIMQFAAAQVAERRELEAANRQLAARAATASQLAESRERNRLARELHDTLAHSLTGLSVQLEALGTLLDRDPAAARSQLEVAKATVKSGILESRRAIQALRATPLEDLGLPEALRQLALRYSERIGIPLICEVGDIGPVDPLAEQTIYRVAEGALSNVERHSAATQVAVRLRRNGREESLRLEVSDNGIGFDPEHVPTGRFGLHVMVERSALVGGTLEIASAPHRGTDVILTLSG